MTGEGPLIAVRDLIKTYVVGEVEVRALRGVSLDVQRGELTSADLGEGAAAWQQGDT